MNHPQLFHLPSSLRRSRSTATEGRQWQQETKGTKVLNNVGIVSADSRAANAREEDDYGIDKTRNGSLPTMAIDSYSPVKSSALPPQLPELHLKSSPVLMHNDNYQYINSPNSAQSRRLSGSESNSTVNSHSDLPKTPRSGSHQTSNSSNRDFIIRKGEVVSVEHSSPRINASPKQHISQMPSPARTAPEFKHPTRTWPHASNTSSKISSSQRGQPSTDPNVAITNVTSPNGRKASVGAHSKVSKAPLPSASGNDHRISATEQSRKTKEALREVLLHPMDPMYVKINIRRPKAGVKHWFDGLDDDSSEEEDVHEPELQEACVGGLDSPYRRNIVEPLPDTPSSVSRLLKSAMDGNNNMTSRSPARPDSTSPTLERFPKPGTTDPKPTEKRSSLPNHTAKRKSNPLNKFDLSQHSILNLSCSDDEDEGQALSRAESAMSGPALRDSIVTDPMDAEVEIGTAKTITAAGHRLTQLDLPRIRQSRLSQQPIAGGPPAGMFPPRRDSRMSARLGSQRPPRSYHGSNTSVNMGDSNAELPSSQRTSIRSSFAPSEVSSFDNWRLMNVTKQEETLLSAMRQKRASMHQVYTHDQRIDALRSLEKRHSRTSTASQHPDLAALHIDTVHLQPRGAHPMQRRLSDGDDQVYYRDSCTTFQTNGSRNDYRSSRATFRSDLSLDAGTRLSYISEPGGEHSTNLQLHSMMLDGRRESRDTCFSTSSAGYQAYRGLFTRNSHVVELDDLDKTPQRDEIPSQAFIDWPYNGWEARAALGMAH